MGGPWPEWGGRRRRKRRRKPVYRVEEDYRRQKGMGPVKGRKGDGLMGQERVEKETGE